MSQINEQLLEREVYFHLLTQAQEKVRAYKRELRGYRRNDDKEMVEFVTQEIRYWKAEAEKYGKKYDEATAA